MAPGHTEQFDVIVRFVVFHFLKSRISQTVSDHFCSNCKTKRPHQRTDRPVRRTRIFSTLVPVQVLGFGSGFELGLGLGLGLGFGFGLWLG